MNFCLACNLALNGEAQYHQKCLKDFWKEDKPVLSLNLDLANIKELARENISQRIIVSVGPSAGLDGSIGVFAGTVKNAKNEQLEFSALEGWGVSDSYSASIFDYESGSNSIRGRYGDSYRSSTVGISAGSPIGYSRNYSYTYTFDLKRFVLGK